MGISLSLGGDINSTCSWLPNWSLGHVLWPTAYRDIIKLKQQYHTMERFFSLQIENGIWILSILNIASFCFKNCLNPPRHAFNQFLILLKWYPILFHLNSFLQLINPIGRFSCFASLLLRQPQRYSIVFRSRDYAGQTIVLYSCSSSQFLTILQDAWDYCLAER